MAEKPPLTLVDPTATHIAPPAKLSEPGRKLWQTIMSEYDFQDAGGLEVLAQICAAQDRVEELRAARLGATRRAAGLAFLLSVHLLRSWVKHHYDEIKP